MAESEKEIQLINWLSIIYMSTQQNITDEPLCVSCRSASVRIIGILASSNKFAGKTISKPINGGNLYGCMDCGLQFRYPRNDMQELVRAYQQGEANWSGYRQQRKDWMIVRNMLTRASNNGKVLDIGCFDGGFLKSLGEGYLKFGIEVNPVASTRAQTSGINIISDNFDNLAAINDAFDTIVAIDVIEHTIDPMKFLSEICSKLIPGGNCIVSTGNTRAWSWRIMGSSYWYCANPEHISFINSDWCYRAAERLGMHIDSIQYFSYRQRTPIRVMYDLTKNLLFKAAPGLFTYLRTTGFGRRDASQHKEIASYPPTWLTAKDHFAVLFHKPDA